MVRGRWFAQPDRGNRPISDQASKPGRCPVVLSANGRVKPDFVIINGQPERHPDGAYYLEWRENGRRVRLSVGKDAADASARRQRKEAELNARNNGVSVLPENGENGHRSIATAVAGFLEETESIASFGALRNDGEVLFAP